LHAHGVSWPKNANAGGGYAYMWHSHTEKEMTNNDIFPGGMMTMLIIVPPDMTMQALPLVPGENPFQSRNKRNRD
jgi:hypothetical protein